MPKPLCISLKWSHTEARYLPRKSRTFPPGPRPLLWSSDGGSFRGCWRSLRLPPGPSWSSASLGKYTSSFWSHRRGTSAGPRGGRHPRVPVKRPPSPCWAGPQPEGAGSHCGLVTPHPTPPDKCVISCCSLTEISGGGCQQDKYSSAFLLSCRSSGRCGLRHSIWMPLGRNKIYRKKNPFHVGCFLVFKEPPQSLAVDTLSKY